MDYWWIFVIIAVFSVAGYIEYRRVPLVRAWAIRHGFNVTTSPDIDMQLQSEILSDVAPYGTSGGWGFGLVLTREMMSARLRVSECRMRLRRGTAWHIVCSVNIDGIVDETVLRDRLPKSLIKREVAIGKHGVVWRRRWLLWPRRLDAVYAEAEEVQEAIVTALHRKNDNRL